MGYLRKSDRAEKILSTTEIAIILPYSFFNSEITRDDDVVIYRFKEEWAVYYG